MWEGNRWKQGIIDGFWVMRVMLVMLMLGAGGEKVIAQPTESRTAVWNIPEKKTDERKTFRRPKMMEDYGILTIVGV